MTITHVATVKFVDRESGSDAGASLSSARGLVALGIWVKNYGDIDVGMTPASARELAGALEHAAKLAESLQSDLAD